MRGRADEQHCDSRLAQQLAAAERLTHVGSWEWTPPSGKVRWSDELCRIYGVEAGEPIAFDSFLSRFHPEDRRRIEDEVGRALRDGDRFGYRGRILRPDGSVRELVTVGEVTRDVAGEVASLLGTCRDVTDERAREDTLQRYADLVHHAEVGLAVWEVADPGDGATVRLVAFNPAARRVARTESIAVGRTLREILPEAAHGTLETLILAAARDGCLHEGRVDRSPDPQNADRAVVIKAFPLPGRMVGTSVDDVTVQARARRLQDAEQRVLEGIASGQDLATTLEAIVLAIEEHTPPVICSIVLCGADGRIHHGAAPHLPPSYAAAIEGERIGPCAGSCGTAAFLRCPVFVEDIEVDPRWERYRDVARAHGLRSCWSTPIVRSDGTVAGTFAIYDRRPRAPTDADREIIARATHLARIAFERKALEDQLHALTAHLESVREAERTRMAREIHDELGQALTALKMDIAWLGRRIEREPTPTRAELRQKLDAMSELADDTIRQVRRISAALRPGVLDDLGLLAAIEWQAQDFEQRSGATCSVHSDFGDEKIDPEVSTVCFRTFQEALTNVVRHANAAHVDARLRRDGAFLVLEVEDDGCGIGPDAAREGRSLGLLGMRERARSLGGTADIMRAGRGGTMVRLRLPLSPPRQGDVP